MFKPTLLLALLLSSTICIVAQQGAPAIEWKRFFGGSRDEKAYSIINAYDNGFLLAGSAKSNDKDLTAHYGSTDSTDAWLVKLDGNGNLEWQKNYGGTGEDEFLQVINTNDQQYVAVGHTRSLNNGDISGFHVSPQYSSYSYQQWDIWVVKINRQGNIVWQRCLGGSDYDKASAIRQTLDGGFILTGQTQSKDGDVIPGPIVGGTDTDAWVVKLDDQGNIEWQHNYGGTGFDNGLDIRVKQDGGYTLVGQTSSGDGDMLPPANFLYGKGFILEISNTGTVTSSQNYIEQGSLRAAIPNASGTGYKFISNSFPCPGGTDMNLQNIVVGVPGTARLWLGYCGGSFAWHSVYGTDILVQNSDGSNVVVGGIADGNTMTYWNNDGFLAGFNNPTQTIDSNTNWEIRYGGNGYDVFTSVLAVGENSFIAVGYSDSYDYPVGDFTGKYGGFDFWVVKYGPANRVKGTVFLDKNGNGVKDTNESFVDNIIVQAKKDTLTYATRPVQGIYNLTVDTGNYSVSILSPPPHHSVIPAAETVSFTSYGLTDSLPAFALQLIPGQRDYEVKIVDYSAMRPGFEVQTWFTYANVGTDTLVNKPVKFIKDSRLQFLSASPVQSSVSGDTLTWNITQLLPGASGLIKLSMKAAAPPALNSGDTISLAAFIDSASDVAPNNNTAIVRRLVTGSYDPNDKQEAHGSTLFRNEYDAGNWLTYTIRFQNTGTDTAFNITIRDTLTDKLVGNSLEMVAASHPYKLLLKDNKYCTWTFNNILLADSNRNEPASHGFITFRVKPVNGLALNDKITNTAAIYFDYNLPVITNTHETVLKATPIPAPAQPVVTGLQAAYCNNLGVQKGKIGNLPLAGGATTATVKLDNATLPIAADSSFAFKVDTLTAGQHQVVVTFTNATATKTYTFDFTITAAVTPEVNVSANITNVVNLTNTVIVTATNAAGGGTAPLYTFAKDKAFTNIMQAEGAGAVLNIDPATLTIGDNKIYVRMKTSATCYTVQTNIDSILIRRDAATGIVDPANPGQVITVAPNPFGNEITVKGLNSGKAYRMVVFNSRGQAMYTSDVKNKSVVTIPAGKILAGVYWLSVYDDKKKLLGTEKLIKY